MPVHTFPLESTTISSTGFNVSGIGISYILVWFVCQTIASEKTETPLEVPTHTLSEASTAKAVVLLLTKPSESVISVKSVPSNKASPPNPVAIKISPFLISTISSTPPKGNPSADLYALKLVPS